MVLARLQESQRAPARIAPLPAILRRRPGDRAKSPAYRGMPKSHSREDGIPPHEKRVRELCDKHRKRILSYNEKDSFILFKRSSDRTRIMSDYKKIFKETHARELFAKIAEIPFHLIISVTPDNSIRNIFEQKKIDHNFDYFQKNIKKELVNVPTPEKPLIYYLFGTTEDESTLVLTFNDMYAYLQGLFSNKNLPQILRTILQETNDFVFIGFQFDKWYFQLLLKLLTEHDKEFKLVCHASINPNLEPDVEEFCEHNFRIDFVENNLEIFINQLHQECQNKNLLRSKEASPIMSEFKPEIFISYGWGGESEAIVNEIYDTFIEKGYNVIRDKINLGFKGNIKEFMEQIGEGKYVIVVISDKYLKSENCMFEILEIKKNGDFYDRIFPIVLRDANIYRPIGRINYINHWQAQIDELNEAIKNVKVLSQVTSLTNDLNLYDYIRKTIDGIMETLKNMNTLTPDMHRGENFQSLFDAIDQKIQREMV